MDELTVTTVARGLSRLLSVWEQDELLQNWKIIVLLHGEENLERLRSECHCIAYFLKWITPHLENKSNIEQDIDPRSHRDGFSPLDALIQTQT